MPLRDQNELSEYSTTSPAVLSEMLFENKLLNELEDADDPLQLFLDYIAFLTSKGSLSSIVRSIMERCFNYINNIQTYQNDPRFVSLWISYINSFETDSGKRLAAYKFMFRHRIGLKLSKFYESFGEFLVSIGKAKMSALLLEKGMAENARPYRRLVRHYEKFKQQFSYDPVPTSIREHDLLTFINETGSIRGEVFQLGTNKNSDTMVTKTLSNEKQEAGRVYKIVQLDGRKPEKIACNFDLLYSLDHGVEHNFEQILAILRNVYYKRDNSNHRESKRKHKDIFRDVDENSDIEDDYKRRDDPSRVEKREESSRAVPIPRENSSKSSLSSKQFSALKRPKVLTPVSSEIKAVGTEGSTPKEMRYSSVTTTSILPLKDESDRSKKLSIRNVPQPEEDQEPDTSNIPRSPTITAFSKDAMRDVYSMFNQNPDPNDLENVYSNNQTVTNYDSTRNFTLPLGDETLTQEFTRQTIDDLTEVKTEIVPKRVSLNMGIDTERPHKNLREATPSRDPLVQSVPQNPIPQDQRISFVHQPPEVKAIGIIEHPLSPSLRSKLLSNLNPPLDRYDTFYRYDQALNMSSFLGRMHRLSASENKSPIIDFKKTNDLYCIRLELGRGGYATVYLAESSTNKYKALKVEKPASYWEYYILKQVEKRLLRLDTSCSSLRSIINVDALHYFTDESYLVLNYANQGTLLDLVNFIREDDPKTALDELLVMFFTIELIKVLGKIHAIGIIHGDLKADNVMVRFQGLPPNCGSLGLYNAQGQNGWSSKGIYLIDFGKSLDLSLFPQGRKTKFKADWKVDAQDCVEMQRGDPWAFEADYFGLAGIIHVLLFGKVIEVIPRGTTSREYKLKTTLKRYWQRDIWNGLFEVLINSGSDKFAESSITDILSTITHEMEAHLSIKQNSNKLISIIRGIEIELNSSRIEGSKRIKKG